MSMKRLGLSLVLSLFTFTALFAHGKGDIEELEVENLNSWQESFDLLGKTTNKAAKYNIMITATDIGGNQRIEGPYNIYIDPNSDLPVCGITNPYPNMRVVSNLNIVGTCVDDDSVSYVELIFDGDDDHPIRAEGREFWSYYLDTVNLPEGPHTIQVTGYDVNGLASKPITLTWQLDRTQPITSIEEKTMGMLVSGNVSFKGTVFDGNGINELFYSVDNGETFIPVKLGRSKEDSSCTFNISIDTRKFQDGPAVIWFKAIDNAGSVGAYSFLYFIDNTKPDVQIVSPVEKEEMNGRFTVTGFAKDKIGITELSWAFGEETGDFELIPGNPYWSINLDTTGSEKEKARKFTVRATDMAGNVIEKSLNIALNQEKDKPIVIIDEPVASQVYTGDDAPVFVRGLALDDDGVDSVVIQLDDREPITQSTKGVFYQELCKASDLDAGNHKITFYAADVNGILGNPTSITIVSKGVPATFENPSIQKGKESEPFENGMEIHPEAGVSFVVSAVSQIGIKHIHTKVLYGKNGVTENDLDLKNVTNYNITFPITVEAPKGFGVVSFVVEATDLLDRVSTETYHAYITNTTVVKTATPEIVFDDSTVGEDGSIINNPEWPVTGYLIGANIKEIALIPETEFAKVEHKGNLIRLIPGNAIGSSEPVKVVVTTDKEKDIESKPLIFRYDNVFPTLTIDNYSDSQALDGNPGFVTISGKVVCSTGVGGVSYRVLGAQAEMKDGLIGAVKNIPNPETFKPVAVTEDGTFRFNVDTVSFGAGMSVVEVVAYSAGGNEVSKGVAVSTVPPLSEDLGKAAKAPVIAWLDGYDVYAVGIYQGEMDRNFEAFSRNDMQEGTNPVTATVTPLDGGKEVTGKYNAVKNPTLTANFALVDGQTYYSGMPVVLPYGVSKTPITATVYIDTGAVVSAVNYEITGDEVPGGDDVQRGSVKLTKPEPGDTRWIAEIPLNNLPSRVNHIAVTVKAGTLEQTIRGSVTVVRSVESYMIEDSEQIFTFPGTGTVFDPQDENWVLSQGSKFYLYANLTAPVSAEIETDMTGLSLTNNGKLFELTATKDGTYKEINIRFTDGFGDTYETGFLNFLSDSESPEVYLQTPKLHEWQNDFVHLSGTAADSLGVRSIEYSFDKGETWKELDIIVPQEAGNLGVTFNQDVDISYLEDGLLSIDIRAIDNAGHIANVKTACFKDTTPPVATVVEPLDDDIVNGDNEIVFRVEDNGVLAKVEYVLPATEEREEIRREVDLNPLIVTHIGTEEQPIDPAMNFIFTDEAGNSQVLSGWHFVIDSESDLPRAEIHVPEDMQVITRDFTISGVVYDDDGESTIWYKLDDGEFIKMNTPSTSFSIDVPIASMTDNEHTVAVYAVDKNGVRGLETVRTFRISLEEPKGAVLEPTIDTSVREVISISGYASDKNGIQKVEVSLDNGNSYNDAEGQEDWVYTFDTRAIVGGTHAVFLKITDNYGITGLYSSLINIDNNAPDISLDLPLDDSQSTGELVFSGYAFDNVEITRMYVTIRNMIDPSDAIVRDLKIQNIIGEVLDISDLSNGFYNIQLTAEDMAGNKTNVSRNIHLDKTMPPAVVDILYPLNGEHKNGQFNIYGQANTYLESPIRSLRLFVDDLFVKETELSYSGFFKFAISPTSQVSSGEYDEDGNPIMITKADMQTGVHTYRVDAMLENGQQVSSRTQTITYNTYGPWVTLDNFLYGNFALNRPYVRGTAGYTISEEEAALLKDKSAKKEEKEKIAAKSVEKIEISFNNGKNFEFLSKKDSWQYRVENEDLPEGYHFMIVRATMKNGETAIERFIVQVDNTAPSIKLIAPTNGGSYNQELAVSGLSQDDVKLESVVVALRKGDKSSYELPSFVQGLYLDVRLLGSTLFEIGAGLTFFDDNVKVQFEWGQFTQAQRDWYAINIRHTTPAPQRYGGNVFGLKLLANISTIPFSYFFGRDWDWLSASVAIGAQFSRFSETNSGRPQMLSAMLFQLEFPRVKLPDVKMFSTFSMYTEGSLWFIPTDVSGTVDIKNIVPQFSLGFRVNVF